MMRRKPDTPPAKPAIKAASPHILPYPPPPIGIVDEPDGRKRIIFEAVDVLLPAEAVDRYLQADETARQDWLRQREKALKAK